VLVALLLVAVTVGIVAVEPAPQTLWRHLYLAPVVIAGVRYGGPAAVVTALASELTRRSVRGDIAMTGEITLSGRVLPVGGIKEKVLAARRAGLREVILPRQNEKNVKEDLSDELRADMTIHLVSEIREVLLLALSPAATPAGVRFHE